MKNKIDNYNIYLFFIMYLVFSINVIMLANNYDDNNSEIIGQYLRNNKIIGNKIVIKVEDMQINEIQSTFYHELGHHIYYEVMNEEERDKWELIAIPINDEYYKNDYWEAFAQKLQEYYNTEGKINNEEIEFIKEILNKYRVEIR